MLTTLLYPPHRSQSFSGYSRPFSSYRPLSVAFNFASPFSLTSSPHHLPEWIIVHLGLFPTRHPPASAARLCALHLMPVSAAVSRVRSSPFADLVLFPGPCRSLGGRPPLVPPSLLCPHLSTSPCESLSPIIFWFLVSFSLGGLFRVRRQGARAHPLPGIPSPQSSPSSANWTCRSRSGYPAPPPPPHPQTSSMGIGSRQHRGGGGEGGVT